MLMETAVGIAVGIFVFYFYVLCLMFCEYIFKTNSC